MLLRYLELRLYIGRLSKGIQYNLTNQQLIQHIQNICTFVVKSGNRQILHKSIRPAVWSTWLKQITLTALNSVVKWIIQLRATRAGGFFPDQHNRVAGCAVVPGERWAPNLKYLSFFEVDETAHWHVTYPLKPVELDFVRRLLATGTYPMCT